MLCERCNQKNATLYVSEYKEGEMKESYLCNACAKIQGNVSGIIQPTFENFLIGILEMALGNNANNLTSKEAESTIAICNNCEMTVNEFRKNGRFGCSTCYETFTNILENALKKIQPDNQHVGKIPERLVPLISTKKEIEGLKKELNEAIRQEKYEEAAKLRDRIKNLGKEGEEDE